MTLKIHINAVGYIVSLVSFIFYTLFVLFRQRKFNSSFYDLQSSQNIVYRESEKKRRKSHVLYSKGELVYREEPQ